MKIRIEFNGASMTATLWGNLTFFYGSYRYSGGLIRLGRIDDDIAPLLVRGKFNLHIELLQEQRRE